MNLILILHVLAFFIGSIPFGYIVGKFYGVDIRDHGSGNIGATNVSRVVGKAPGYITLTADIAKGLLSVLLVCLIPPSSDFIFADSLAASLGLFAVLGHCYSPFMKFNGGKGVATAFGVFITLAPISAFIALGVSLLTLRLSRYVSLSAILAAVAIPISYAAIGKPEGMLMTVAITVACVVISRHKSNIYRIAKGTEPKSGLFLSEYLPEEQVIC